MIALAGHGKDPQLVQPSIIPEFQIGDRIKDKEGFIGVIKSTSDRCITASNKDQIKSYNLTQFKNIRLFIECLPTSEPLKESEHSPKPVAVQAKSKRSPISTSTNTRKQSSKTISQMSQSIARQLLSNESSILIAVSVGTIVKPKFNGGTGKVISSTSKKISVSWSGANNIVEYTIAEFHNHIDIIEQAISVNNIDARLQFLLEQRDRLINSGASPQGVWLSVGQVYKKDFRQVVWKSAKEHEWLGGNKSRYIGKENSDEHVSAIAQHKAGQELRKIEREIKKLQV
jgi:hypothetical protein